MYNSNGLSAKVNDFVQLNMPAEQQISVSNIEVAAKATDLTFTSDKSAHPSFQSENFRFALLTQLGPTMETVTALGRGLFPRRETKKVPIWQGAIFNGDALVRWMYSINEDMVTYKPYLGGWNSSRGKSPDEIILEQLGIEPIIVKMPEKVVVMPIPSWTWANDGDGNGFLVDPYTTTMFLSEARESASKFIEQLKAVL